ncbi:hypothetical protein Q3G72_021475 [Acer saccharum]|nr:hypothetical protein Q3G72_021475 [Acer saccharum]
MQELQQKIPRVIAMWGSNGSKPSEKEYKEEMAKNRKGIVNFHSEIVLLVNYSNMNYNVTGEGIFRNLVAALLTKQEIREVGALLTANFLCLHSTFQTPKLFSQSS